MSEECLKLPKLSLLLQPAENATTVAAVVNETPQQQQQ